ncbi:SWI/SNF family trascriptional activator protein, putative [Theileria annulata]|uniref:SWI/SNF family trascriptional activator protein, putative n=1 Tax=Theileria annulata TaxID=5874 RepID=Q4UIC8_THEAN|nr:SWI/SNF family trascriptional activator protein, putative [Theileria annulata]CAI73161.1 SWI/SNF family trascriptional activator protein, putative [Theileria annulata]|eukprot:XP_953839.1 SWI/SNF family trascriptional activator protein, putative [Theileria annulata]
MPGEGQTNSTQNLHTAEESFSTLTQPKSPVKVKNDTPHPIVNGNPQNFLEYSEHNKNDHEASFRKYDTNSTDNHIKPEEVKTINNINHSHVPHQPNEQTLINNDEQNELNNEEQAQVQDYLYYNPANTTLLHKILNEGGCIDEILAMSRTGVNVKFKKSEIKKIVEAVDQPKILVGQSKPYQIEGLKWLVGLYVKGLNGILADEMGLGKTFQTISFLAYLKETFGVHGPHMVLAPKSTIGNWISEINRFCPSLRVLKFIGNKEERTQLIAYELDPEKYDIFVTSYETCCKAKGPLGRLNWKYLIIDEAHRIKNEESKLSEVVRLFRTEYRLLITGTPLQNNLKELWALLNFLFPVVFSSSEEFETVFDLVGPKELTQEEREERNLQIVARLHGILRPFMLRRSKKDVLSDMPQKNELLLMVPLSAMQKQLYRDLLRKNVPELGVDDNTKSGIHVQLLNLAMQLRKACNHPYLFEGYEDRNEDPFGEHVVQNSGKLSLVDKLIPRLLGNSSRILIFSQMARMLDILEDYCRMRNYLYFRIDGNTSSEDRDYQISSFNQPDSMVNIFLLSTRAGGLGINLATADVVILYDSDWNPQVDLQAIDRAHRIGQLKPVYVYRLVHQYTIEEKIIERATMKLQLDTAVIQHGRLAQKELLQMVQYGAGHIFKAGDEAITDEDLDVILSKGQERANLMNQKLISNTKKHLLDFSTSTTSNIYGYLDDDENEEDKEAWSKLEALKVQSEALIERESRRKLRIAKEQMELYTSNKSDKPLLLPEYQFFDNVSLLALNKKEIEIGLTEEEQQQKDELLSKGFSNWSRKDFNNFIKANVMYSRYDINSIASFIDGKTYQEVEQYSKTFWQKYNTLPDWAKYIKKIEQGEENLLKIHQLHQTIVEKQKQLKNPWVGTEVLFSAHRGKSTFSEDEDRFLMNIISLFGYEKWSVLVELIRLDPKFQFNLFFRSRNAIDISKRADYIIKHISKEVSLHLEATKVGSGERPSKRGRKDHSTPVSTPVNN